MATALPHQASSWVGVGLRPAHAAGLRAAASDVGFVQVHSENFFADGGAKLSELLDWRARTDVSLHGVGLSLGSACGIDEAHLAELARLVERVDPVRVSDHACFARGHVPGDAPGQPPATVHAADLLPLAFTDEALGITVANVQHVQERLQRPILVENLSSYLVHTDNTWSEADFLIALCQRSGCQLLLDLNNLLVNGINQVRRQDWQTGRPATPDAQALRLAQAAALDLVWALPPGLVGEIHLAGFRWPDATDKLVIDDHSQRMSAPAWELFEQTLAHLGPVPTVIEWDTDLPPVAVLLDEARLATQALTPHVAQDDDAWDL